MGKIGLFLKNIFKFKTLEEKLFEELSNPIFFNEKKFSNLLEKNASKININHQDENGNTLLHLSGGKSFFRKSLASYLIEKGAKTDIINKNGETPLFKNIHLLTVKDLSFIQNTDSKIMNFVYPNGETIFTKLFQKTPFIDSKIIQGLIDNGANLNTPNKTGHTPLYYTVFHKVRFNPSIFFDLIEKGARFSKTDLSDFDLLKQIEKQSFLILGLPAHHLLKEKDQSDDTILLKMLKKPIDYTFNGTYDLSVLSNENIKEKIIEKVISLSNINEPDKTGKKPLELAVQNRRYQFILRLIQEGADISFTNEKDETLLHFAVLREDEKLLSTLLSLNKIDINSPDQNGNTPLHLAIKKEKMVELLLKNGADPTLKNKENLSALDLSLQTEEIIIPLKLKIKQLEIENSRLNAQLIGRDRPVKFVTFSRQYS